MISQEYHLKIRGVSDTNDQTLGFLSIKIMHDEAYTYLHVTVLSFTFGETQKYWVMLRIGTY